MTAPEDKIPESEDQTPETEEVEVVAHSGDDEELNAGCVINSSNALTY